MKKKYPFIRISILVVILFLSCSKSEKGDDLIEESNNEEQSNVEDSNDNENSDDNLVEETVTLKIDGLEDFDFSKYETLSPFNSESIGSNGTFIEIMDTQTELENPVLIMKDDEILFGYYPSIRNGGDISIENILYYFFLEYPPVNLYLNPNSDLLFYFINHPNFSIAKEQFVQMIKSDELPFANEQFLNRIFDIGNELINENIENKNSSFKKSISNDFFVSFGYGGDVIERRGTSIGCYNGVQIIDKRTNQEVFSAVLEGQNFFSFGTWYNRWRSYVNEGDLTPPDELNFSNFQDSEYSFRFTNGNVLGDEFSEKVSNNNIIVTIIQILGLIPINPNADLYNNSCAVGKIGELVVDLKLYVAQLSLTDAPVSSASVIDFITPKLDLLQQTIIECSPENTFFEQLIKRFELANLSNRIKWIFRLIEIGSLVTQINDAFFSRIDVTDSRFYDQGSDFGKLIVKDEDIDSFIDDSYREGSYLFTVYEINNSFVINKENNETRINSIESIFFDEIEFNAEVIEGDAEILTQNPITRGGFSGIDFKVDFSYRSEDSKVKLTPNFSEEIFESPIIFDVNVGAVVDLTEVWVLERESQGEFFSWDFNFTEEKADEWISPEVLTQFDQATNENAFYYYDSDLRTMEIEWEQIAREDDEFICENGDVFNLKDLIQDYSFVGTYSGENRFEGELTWTYFSVCPLQTFTQTFEATFIRRGE